MLDGPCVCCGKPFSEEEHRFVFESSSIREMVAADFHRRFWDCMHWDCYLTWSERVRFEAACFKFWVEHESQSVSRHKVFLDEETFVTVDPDKDAGSIMVFLKPMGSRRSVPLSEWEQWLAEGAEPGMPEAIAVTLAWARQALKAQMPTKEVLLSRIDWAGKQQLINAHKREQERQRELKEQQPQQMLRHNEACQIFEEKARREGIHCPHCGAGPEKFRLSCREGHPSAIICRSCGLLTDPLSGDQA